MKYAAWFISAVTFAVLSRTPIVRRRVSAGWAFALDYSPWRLW